MNKGHDLDKDIENLIDLIPDPHDTYEELYKMDEPEPEEPLMNKHILEAYMKLMKSIRNRKP